jgi:hypothetical protein
VADRTNRRQSNEWSWMPLSEDGTDVEREREEGEGSKQDDDDGDDECSSSSRDTGEEEEEGSREIARSHAVWRKTTRVAAAASERCWLARPVACFACCCCCCCSLLPSFLPSLPMPADISTQSVSRFVGEGGSEGSKAGMQADGQAKPVTRMCVSR